MKYVVVIGRILYSIIFFMTIRSHFSGHAVEYATAKGVPMASLLVPISGVIAIAGALSITLGYKAKAGAWLIILFLLPVSFFMHAFWSETDPMQSQIQMTNFLKNMSMIGAALLISYFGPGPLSIDERTEPRVTVKGFTLEKGSAASSENK